MIGHSLSMYKLRGKIKIDMDTSVQDQKSSWQNYIYVYIKLDLKEAFGRRRVGPEPCNRPSYCAVVLRSERLICHQTKVCVYQVPASS
jgi:hypothetical protein